MKLFHFSEESSIEQFVPRVKENRKNMPPVVWAIDDLHDFTFYFPRACPRIVYTKSGEISPKDNDKFFGLTHADTVITVESRWYERIKNVILYRYSLPIDSFQLFDEFAGYYISQEIIVPIEKETIGNPLEKLAKLNIEVRFTPSLFPLREAILESTVIDFGIHRFENARDY